MIDGLRRLSSWISGKFSRHVDFLRAQIFPAFDFPLVSNHATDATSENSWIRSYSVANVAFHVKCIAIRRRNGKWRGRRQFPGTHDKSENGMRVSSRHPSLSSSSHEIREKTEINLFRRVLYKRYRRPHEPLIYSGIVSATPNDEY